MSPVALGIMFFLVITPTKLLTRLFGKDPDRNPALEQDNESNFEPD